MSRLGNTKGKAERSLDRALKPRATASTAATIQPSLTVGQLANYWLGHREATGLALAEGPLQPSSLRAMEVAVRT